MGYSGVILKGVLLLAVTVFQVEQAQRDCSSHRNVFLSVPTTAPSVNMTCPVDAGGVIANTSELFLWKWLRLRSNSIEDPITNRTTLERDQSVYSMPVECRSSGLYQALYFNAADNGSCLFSCVFAVEVFEAEMRALQMDFSGYTNISCMSGTVPSSPSIGSAIGGRIGTVQSVGTCGDKFYLASMCVVEVEGRWYRNGTQFNPRSDTQNYYLSTTGELRIQNLTEITVGYYVCVTQVDNLGCYQTADANIVLAQPGTEPPPSTTTTPTTTTDILTVPDDQFGRLRAWQFGIIIGVVSLIIIVILLSGAVWMGRMTAKRRREGRKPGRVTYKRTSPPRPKSMMEEIQMLEEMHEESVDFGVSSSPVEIQFNCILFEELLHKGTFKVVHHGIVNQPAQGMLGIQVAIKRLKDEKSELGYEELMNEAIMLRTIQEKVGSHPNIVSLLGMTTHGGPTCLLLEFVPNGTLNDFLDLLRVGPIPEWYMKFVRDTLRGAYHKHVSGDLMNITLQVAEGMKFLTDHGFIHRDLSARNILMGDRMNIKIANPGMNHEGYYYIVSEREEFFQDMAPECLWEKRYSICSDVWSFGILVYRTVTLNATPFPNMEVNELHGRMVGGERPQLLTSFSNEMYFLLQRCWQFVATERPSFSTLYSDLSHMADKPTRHIILKATKDWAKPGYVSDNGQVFLRALPPHALDEDEPPQKKARRSSGTLRSLISSIDDTVYTRETAETVLDFTQSETENEAYNNYERYLRGDIPKALPVKVVNRRSYDETDTSGNDVNPGTSKERVKSAGRKTSKSAQHDTANTENADAVSTGKVSGTSSSKKKKRRTPSNASREKKGAMKAAVGYANKGFSSTNNSAAVDVIGARDSGDFSTDGAPSITEEEDKEGGTSDLSGSDLGGSQSELVRL